MELIRKVQILDQKDLTQSGGGGQPGKHRKGEGGGGPRLGGEEGEGGKGRHNLYPFKDHAKDRDLFSLLKP